MNLKNISICFGPTIFPENIVKLPKHMKEPFKLAHTLYHLDHERIDKGVYDRFQKWLKKHK
ncbi:hypothetical protein GVAV_001314 [Gurleya vavrai]